MQSGVTHVLFAFTVMGGWAIIANQAHPMPKPLVAGLVQGTLSALITLFLKTTIDRLSSAFSGAYTRWLPPLMACSISLCILIAVHSLAGTPEAIKTIALPFSVAATYAGVYAHSLRSKGSLRHD